MGKRLKLSLLACIDWREADADAEERKEEPISLNEEFKQITDKIIVNALPCTQMPSASNMIPMLNI